MKDKQTKEDKMGIIRIEAKKWKFETGLSDNTCEKLRALITVIAMEKESLINEVKALHLKESEEV